MARAERALHGPHPHPAEGAGGVGCAPRAPSPCKVPSPKSVFRFVPSYRRNWLPGGTYFFTVVTADRKPVLCRDEIRRALRRAIAETREALPFDIVAWVLLPDHLHCIWALPIADDNYPRRWNLIKGRTTKLVGRQGATHASGRDNHDIRLWQRRYWEHTVRDEGDLQRHLDYVHWNPVRHGLVREAADWPYSTFHRYCRDGLYPRHWGGGLGKAELEAGE